MNDDLKATVVGGALAVLSAAEPTMNLLSTGVTLHQADYVQFAFAALMALFGWITNRQKKAPAAQ